MRYGFLPGTKVVWLEREGDLIPKPLLSVDELSGRYRQPTGRPTDALRDERALERKREDG
jgi:hypothetical protein